MTMRDPEWAAGSFWDILFPRPKPPEAVQPRRIWVNVGPRLGDNEFAPLQVFKGAGNVLPWIWECWECGWVGLDHSTQQGALREALRHFKEDHPTWQPSHASNQDVSGPSSSRPRDAPGTGSPVSPSTSRSSTPTNG